MNDANTEYSFRVLIYKSVSIKWRNKMHHQRNEKIIRPRRCNLNIQIATFECRWDYGKKSRKSPRPMVLFAFCACMRSYMRVSGRHPTKFLFKWLFQQNFPSSHISPLLRILFSVAQLCYKSTVQFNLMPKLRGIFLNFCPWQIVFGRISNQQTHLVCLRVNLLWNFVRITIGNVSITNWELL